MVRLDSVSGKVQEDIEKGAYYRCFGNVGLSQLLSKVQSLSYQKWL